MTAWARSYRAAFAARARATPLLMTPPAHAPKVLDQYERAGPAAAGAGTQA
ncbi:hypothetical protein ACFVFH_02145 [Streptomyces sp. NPDC057697]|uniref:hypothetical protein n=1 Tax=Streptomyces sp. NPDC057697 TaxID=3346219 RepID=UPI00369EE03B